jgi:hypothetical protein
MRGTEYRNLADARRRIAEFLEQIITGKGCIRRYDISRQKSSSRPAKPEEVTALMEAVENKKQVHHRSHKAVPFTPLRAFHECRGRSAVAL